MKKTILFGIAGVLLAAGVATTAYAYQGNPAVHGPNYTPEREAAMTTAFEKNDYEAWKTLMNGRGRVSEVITTDNFEQFAEMRKLQLEGKTAEANAIRTELGLGNGQGRGQGKGNGMHYGTGKGRGQQFVDANNDGVCDNFNK